MVQGVGVAAATLVQYLIVELVRYYFQVVEVVLRCLLYLFFDQVAALVVHELAPRLVESVEEGVETVAFRPGTEDTSNGLLLGGVAKGYRVDPMVHLTYFPITLI